MKKNLEAGQQPRKFVIGDIHGAWHALVQCLERCGFRNDIDVLITLGDICDGWQHVYECVDILLKIKNRIDIIGNHDRWFWFWLNHGVHPDQWRQGGRGTMDSYIRAYYEIDTKDPLDEHCLWERGEDGIPVRKFIGFNRDWVPQSHHDFFNKQVPYYKDDKNRLFIHGGFYRFQTLQQQRHTNEQVFWWDRELWNEALSASKTEPLKFKEEFSEIFIGHTATIYWTKYKAPPLSKILMPTEDPTHAPMHADIIYNLDTGAGSTGRLTIMDVDTHEYWQSDPVNTFYGEYKPRG